MIKIFSKVNPEKLLHFVVKKEDFVKGRVDLIPPDQFLQCSTLNLKRGTTFKPHQHVWKQHNLQAIAQESWVVLSGSVSCFFYDTDGAFLKRVTLRQGEASFTLEGGHNYKIRVPETRVLEYKTGPYFGQQLDKTFINAE